MGLFIALLLLNGIVFCLFGSDKLLAKFNWRRVSERSLYIAIIFGPIGALLSMMIFRHKTSKTSFHIGAIMPFVLGFALIISALYWQYF